MCAGGRERVKAHLRILFKQGEGADEKKRVDARIKRVSRRYWKRMCRWEIGAPQELARDLLRVYDFFKDLIDPATGLSFFGPDHAKRCAHELAYVAAGYLSDRPELMHNLFGGQILDGGEARCLYSLCGRQIC